MMMMMMMMMMLLLMMTMTKKLAQGLKQQTKSTQRAETRQLPQWTGDSSKSVRDCSSALGSRMDYCEKLADSFCVE
jgi:hypothetical protein